VPTFVPAQADFPLVLPAKIAVGVGKILIDKRRRKDLRIRNAWVRGSNPLCGTNFKIFGDDPRRWVFGASYSNP
jgi:hypothetical protein